MTTYVPLNLRICVGYDLTGLSAGALTHETKPSFKDCFDKEVDRRLKVGTINRWDNLVARIGDLQMDPATGIVNEAYPNVILGSEIQNYREDVTLSEGGLFHKYCEGTPQGWRKYRFYNLNLGASTWRVGQATLDCYKPTAFTNPTPAEEAELRNLAVTAAISWTVYEIP